MLQPKQIILLQSVIEEKCRSINHLLSKPYYKDGDEKNAWEDKRNALLEIYHELHNVVLKDKKYYVEIIRTTIVEVISTSKTKAKQTVKEMYEGGDACAELGDAKITVIRQP